MVVLYFKDLIEPQQADEGDDIYRLHHQPLNWPAPVGEFIQHLVVGVPVLNFHSVIFFAGSDQLGVPAVDSLFDPSTFEYFFSRCSHHRPIDSFVPAFRRFSLNLKRKKSHFFPN